MEVVNQAFEKARQLFKSVVPPCSITIDTPEDFEVRALKNNTDGDKHGGKLFGYVIKHADSITIGFDTDFKDSIREQLFSSHLLQMMNHHSRIRIHEMNHQTHLDLQYAIEHLLRYYTDENWA